MTKAERQAKFEKLVEDHKRILYKIANSYAKSRDDSEDLAQEILGELWAAFPKYDERFRFSTWMYRISLNVAISFSRRERSRKVVYDDRLLETVGGGNEPSDEVRWLYDAIARLEPLNRALILLYLDGYSYQEIADVLGLTETNVSTKISRLKQTMKQDLAAEVGEESRR